jgi:hypothetical protein
MSIAHAAAVMIAALLLSPFTLPADARVPSCSEQRAVCNGRGGASTCSTKYNVCRITGCWTEAKRYGGGTTCSLRRA